MAYRFATVLGLAGLMAQSAVALPVAQGNAVVVQTATQVVTVTAGGAQPTAAAPTSVQAPAAPVAEKQAAAPVAQSSAPVSSSSTPSTGSSSSGSSAGHPGRGVCVDGNLGPAGTSELQKLLSSGFGAINWYTNWGGSGQDLNNGKTKFYPQMKDLSVTTLSKGDIAISFNEADMAGGMGGNDAATVCKNFKKQYLPAAKGIGAKTTTPSYTSRDCKGTDASMGTCWFKAFWEQCGSEDIDYANVHYYFNPVNGQKPADFSSPANFNYFTQLITDAHTISGKPVLVSEFGLDSDNPAQWSNAEHAAFFSAAESWLSKQSFVAGWGGFMVSNKQGTMNSGSGADLAAKYMSS